MIDFFGEGTNCECELNRCNRGNPYNRDVENIEMGNAAQNGNVKRLNTVLFNIEQMYDKT